MSVTISGMRAASTFQVSYGGTGQNTLTSGSLIVGNGTDPVGVIAPGTEGQILTVVSGAWAAADNAGGSGTGGISAVSSSGNLQGDGTSGSVLTLKDNISLTSVTASFSGSGAGLTGIPNSALQNSFININGDIIPLGSSYNILTYNANQLYVLGNNLQGSTSDINDPLNLKPNITITSATGSFSGSFIGDGSRLTGVDSLQKIFTATGIAVGQLVALSGSLVVADNSDSMKSNIIGVATNISGTSVTVKLFGEVSVNGASSFAALGTEMYLGSSGVVTSYSNIGSGKYVTQVGFISDTGKIILQPRVFGQKA